MTPPMLWLALLLVIPPTLVALVLLATTLYATRRLSRLTDEPIPPRDDWPPVSVIVPACDEEERLAVAAPRLLSLDYPALELIVVDDRSTDRTGALLDELAARDERCRALHVTQLPAGWLGKVHALQTGLAEADGDWLLFCDADTELAPTALPRAIAYAERKRLDFLTVIPTIGPAGFVGDAVFSFSVSLIHAAARTWAVADPQSDAVAGCGAFLLVRRAALDHTPGLDWLRLEVADDFGLCLLLKSHGGRCDIVNGRDEVSLVWYASFGEMSRSMQKNFFAILGGFSVLRCLALALLFGWLALFPLAGLLAPTAVAPWAVAALGEIAFVAAMLIGSRWTGRSWRGALVPPLGLLATSYMIARAGLVGWRIGGIEWRGVCYPSAELKRRQRVRPGGR